MDVVAFQTSSGKLRPKYRVTCQTCHKDRGYKLWQNCKTHPNCSKCAKQLDRPRRSDFWKDYHKHHAPWNKGLKGCHSVETRAKIGYRSANRNYSDEKRAIIRQRHQLTCAIKQGFASLAEWQVAQHLKKNMRSRLSKAFASNTKTGSAVNDLGCTIAELKRHLESKFQPGMSWINYGEWQIDHIKPLNQFNLTLSEERLVACNYMNLQPLWKKDNLEKRHFDGTFP